MSKKHKKHPSPRNEGKDRAGTSFVSRPGAFGGEETEPVAERRPVPIWIIVLLVVLLYWGDMYIMNHGADVMGKTGPFPKLVFDPYRNYEDLVMANPIDPVGEARRKGKLVFNLACVACHQGTGQGTPGQFPPLAGSDWVNAEGPNRIIRIVLNGASGPITVLGQQFNNTMVAWKDTLSDEQIASVLTYVRSEWGNKSAAVTPEQVKKIRAQVADRGEPWSEAELGKVSVKD
jgi:mono/diheme cytochrome c family protein